MTDKKSKRHDALGLLNDIGPRDLGLVAEVRWRWLHGGTEETELQQFGRDIRVMADRIDALETAARRVIEHAGNTCILIPGGADGKPYCVLCELGCVVESEEYGRGT
jgi:hypothetical protein